MFCFDDSGCVPVSYMYELVHISLSHSLLLLFISYLSLQCNTTKKWLFGKSIRKGKIGNVNAYEDSKYSTLPKDGVFRVWYKSDPATTAVFDRRSMEYIVNSVEGKKYYHFFKSMLLGSEEVRL